MRDLSLQMSKGKWDTTAWGNGPNGGASGEFTAGEVKRTAPEVPDIHESFKVVTRPASDNLAILHSILPPMTARSLICFTFLLPT